MNEQTLEMQIHSNNQQAIASLNKLLTSIGVLDNGISKVTTTVNKNGETVVKNLTSISKEGNNVYKVLQKIDKDGNLKVVSASMNALKGNVEKTSNRVDKLKSSTDKATSGVSKFSQVLSLGGAYLGAKRLTGQMLSWMNEAVDFTEQLNLFNVVFKNVEKNGVTAFSNIGKEATQFQYKLNEAFGTNKTQTLYMQGIFQSMGENVGIGDTYSAIMSETMTKLTYDLASLYNKSEKTTAEAIRAGVYAGQTKPLRSFGVDVTQMSLQPIADSLGLDTQVKNMSQAEKEILRYLATLKQAQVAMGDFANTVNNIAAHIRNYMMKKLVNLYKKGVKIIKNDSETRVISLLYCI